MLTPEIEESIRDALKERAENLPKLNNLPFCYLLAYVPEREHNADNASDENREARSIVYAFKTPNINGDVYRHGAMAQTIALAFVYFTVNRHFKRLSRKLYFLCAPASTKQKREERFKGFSERVCEETGMQNGYDYIYITTDGSPKHAKDSQEQMKYIVDYDEVKGKLFVLFDDVVTTGKTLATLAETIERFGGTVIAAISLAKTKGE